MNVADARAAYDAARTAEDEAKRAYRAAEAEIAKPLNAAVHAVHQARKALADAIAAERGIKIGDEREWRGKRYSLSGWTYDSYADGDLNLYGVLIRKDGSRGAKIQRLW